MNVVWGVVGLVAGFFLREVLPMWVREWLERRKLIKTHGLMAAFTQQRAPAALMTCIMDIAAVRQKRLGGEIEGRSTGGAKEMKAIEDAHKAIDARFSGLSEEMRSRYKGFLNYLSLSELDAFCAFMTALS